MKREITSKTYRFTLNLILTAQAFVLLAFSMVVLFLNATNGLSPIKEMTQTFQYIVPVSVIIFLSSAYFIFKIFLSKINRSEPLRVKLPKYQNALIVRSALLELPGLLGAVAAMLTGEMYFLAATLLILIIFLILRPTLYNIIEDLQLTGEEKALFENPEAIVSQIE